jgi:rubredoxin
MTTEAKTATMKCVVCGKVIDEIEVKEEENYIPKKDQEALDVHICRTCARKDKLAKLIKEYEPFMEKFSKLVNNCAFDHDGLLTDALIECFFREHRYLQNEMILGIRNMFEKIGKHAGDVCYEDPRNQWALKWCKQVSQTY